VIQRSEHALVKRILAGDREACVEFVALYHAPIYRLLVHLCRDMHIAEDLTQESFLAAWKNLGSFKASSSLSTWLHQIAYRKFIDSHRRAKRAVFVETQTPIDELKSVAPTPYDKTLVSDENRRLYQALDNLPPAERDVVVLHYLQGLNYEEMAAVLSQPSGTVKWRTREALAKMRKTLDRDENK
jgi:RNA polymerase sigma-70 factor, ECF subfamily